MFSPQAMFKGLVSRLLPQPLADGPEAERFVRLGRYGNVKIESHFPTDHMQADEGSLFVAATEPGAAALQLGISASFSATAAAFAIQNGETISALGGGKRVMPKALRLCVSTVGTSGVDLRYAIVIDKGNRTPTTISNAPGAAQGPGTPATATAYRSPVQCTNSDVVDRRPVTIPYFPMSTAAGAPPAVPAASPSARTLVGNGFIKNTALAVKDQLVLQFGSADRGGTLQGASAAAKIIEHAPAIVLGPQDWMLIYLWSTSNATAGNAFDDVSFEAVEY